MCWPRWTAQVLDAKITPPGFFKGKRTTRERQEKGKKEMAPSPLKVDAFRWGERKQAIPGGKEN